MQSNVIQFPRQKATPMPDHENDFTGRRVNALDACIASAHEAQFARQGGRMVRVMTPSGAPIDAPVPDYAGFGELGRSYVEARVRDSARLYQDRHGAAMLEALLAEIVADAHAAERA